MIEFVITSFVGQISQFSVHPFACRVVQRLLEHCNENQRQSIINELLLNFNELCQSAFANYVIQHVIQYGTKWHKSEIINGVRGKIGSMSRHKFASNIIEKCFTYGNENERQMLLDEILTGNENDPTQSPLIQMVKDQVSQKHLCLVWSIELCGSCVRVLYNY